MLTYIEMQRGPASKELSSLDAVKQQLGSSRDPSPVTNVAFFEFPVDPTFVVYEEAGQCLCRNVSFFFVYYDCRRNSTSYLLETCSCDCLIFN